MWYTGILIIFLTTFTRSYSTNTSTNDSDTLPPVQYLNTLRLRICDENTNCSQICTKMWCQCKNNCTLCQVTCSTARPEEYRSWNFKECKGELNRTLTSLQKKSNAKVTFDGSYTYKCASRRSEHKRPEKVICQQGTLLVKCVLKCVERFNNEEIATTAASVTDQKNSTILNLTEMHEKEKPIAYKFEGPPLEEKTEMTIYEPFLSASSLKWIIALCICAFLMSLGTCVTSMVQSYKLKLISKKHETEVNEILNKYGTSSIPVNSDRPSTIPEYFEVLETPLEIVVPTEKPTFRREKEGDQFYDEPRPVREYDDVQGPEPRHCNNVACSQHCGAKYEVLVQESDIATPKYDYAIVHDEKIGIGAGGGNPHYDYVYTCKNNTEASHPG